MTSAAMVALAIVVFGAFSYAAAAILQAVAARRSTTTVQTMGHPLYLIGIGFDIMAWVGSMIALRELPVYVVETILAGSLAITVVAARFVLGSRLRGRDVFAVAMSVLALTALAMSAGPQHKMAPSMELRIGFCVAAAVIAVLGWLATRGAPAGVIAALGGLSLGSAALAGRALPSAPMDIVTDPITAALLVFAGSGMLLYANALGRGEVGPVTAVHWTAEVVAPSAVAFLLLGDAVRPGFELVAAVAGVVTVGSAVLLATAPASQETGHTADDQPALPAPARPAPGLAAPVRARHAERVIWWGPPPIWRPPPSPARPALTGRSMPALQWSPPVPAEASWAPRRPDADPVEAPRPSDRIPSDRHRGDPHQGVPHQGVRYPGDPVPAAPHPIAPRPAVPRPAAPAPPAPPIWSAPAREPTDPLRPWHDL